MSDKLSTGDAVFFICLFAALFLAGVMVGVLLLALWKCDEPRRKLPWIEDEELPSSALDRGLYIQRACEVCGRPMATDNPAQLTCTDGCRFDEESGHADLARREEIRRAA